MSTIPELFFLFLVALAGGFSNTIVGGGWFIVFPGLIYRGVSPVFANATTMLTLWSGHIYTSNSISNETRIQLPNLKYLILSCASGGFLGAILVAIMPHSLFEHVGPFLLLGSFLLFAFYEQILGLVVSRIAVGKEFKYSHAMLVPLFFLGVYGGYFGAGTGMVFFMLYRSYGITDTMLLERIASILVSVNAGIALIVFICSGLISWPFVPVLVAGSVLGGYVGILARKRINTTIIKGIMITIGAIVTLYFLNLVI